MSEYVFVSREINPSCKLPTDLDTPVWRYMDMYKFKSLLENKALHLCRADLLQERFEGIYSRQQILGMNDWLIKIGAHDIPESERDGRRKGRIQTYISSWCISDCDLDLMWKGYVRNPPGVAIKSSIRRLKKICDEAITYRPLDISEVTYFDHAEGEHIDYSMPNVFLYKDKHFSLDKELRIIYYPNILEPTPPHILLTVDLNDLIEEVVLQPKINEGLNSVREVLNKVGLEKIPVSASRDDRELLA